MGANVNAGELLVKGHLTAESVGARQYMKYTGSLAKICLMRKSRDPNLRTPARNAAS